LFPVLTSIDFDYDPRRMTGEIDDVSSEPNLPPKVRLRER